VKEHLMSNRNRTRAVVVVCALAYGGLAAVTLASPVGAATTAVNARLSHTLTVLGDSRANAIVLSRDLAGDILVNGGGVAIEGPKATVFNVKQIRILAGAGNDTVSLDETNGALPRADIFGGLGNDRITGSSNLNRLLGGPGSDVLIGGRGDELLSGGGGSDFVDGNQGTDDVVLGDGNDTFQWDPGDGSDRVDGNAGRDVMLFNGSAAGELFDVSANAGRVLFTRSVGSIAMDLGGIEEIDTRTLGGVDSFAAHDLSGTGVTTLEVDDAAAGAPDNTGDRFSVEGTDAADVITVSGSAATGVSITGTAASVHFTNTQAFDEFDVQAAGGDDTVTASGLAAGVVAFSADGGAGNDVITGSAGDDVLHGGDGDDVLTGGPGNDVLDGGTGADVLIQ
jgi:Ca2+-binding RTX toxin-like protein